ncbi:MAG TPA: diguanylate cyclase [Candidatus Limnocylindrales bacterium]|jgi:diguanylate cyclase (GGDEF)-like protein
MPTPDTLLAIILLAVAANLIVGGAVLAAPRLRNRNRADDLTIVPGDRLPRVPAGRPGEGRGVAVFGPVGLSGGGHGAGLGAAAADPGTGLDLPPSWSRWLQEEDSRIRRYRHPATVVLIEIEGMDRLSERLGPDAGDRLIPPVAATLRRYARDVDRIARLGPRSFGVLLPETDEVQAINYIERVRTTCDLWLASGAVTLRLAIGWAEANQARTVEVALATAEDRLNVERRRNGRGGAAGGAADSDSDLDRDAESDDGDADSAPRAARGTAV